MRLYGLTGGIASGKSTVGRIFMELDVPVIDADLLAREVVAPGRPALAEISKCWPQAIGADGALNRGAMAAIIFEDPEARAALEAMTHPRIRAEAARRVTELASRGTRFALYEAALVFETKAEVFLDGVILVAASRDLQIARLQSRDGYSAEDIERRIAAQLPLEEKRRRAQWVIENDWDLTALRAAVVSLEKVLRETSG